MTDEFDRYFNDFGRDLRQADATQAPRRPAARMRLAVVGVAAGLAVAAVIALLPGGGGLDPVARAQAALALDGKIVHYAYSVHTLVGPERKSDPPASMELWQATDPLRVRMATNSNGSVSEFAYADGVNSSYDPKRRTLNRMTNVPESAAEPGAQDQVAMIRKQLASGVLHEAGTATVRGRTVVRLVGREVVKTHGWWMSMPPKRMVMVQTTELQYDVDPKTYAPVRLRTIERHPPFGAPGPVITTFDFAFYETLPATAENLRQLRIQPAPGTTVTSQRMPPQPDPDSPPQIGRRPLHVSKK